MADISVYKLVLADQPGISQSSIYPSEKKTDIDNIYLNPDKKKLKNITEIDNTLDRSKIHNKDNTEPISHKIKSSGKFEWINI